MTARTHQNRTQASQAKTRSGSRNNRVPSVAGGSRQSSRGKRRKSEKSDKSARAIWMMVMVGSVIGAIFILAQRYQISTLHLKRAEEGLKSEFDTLASQQRYLSFQRDKALSTQESQKAAGEFNLAQPGFGRAITHVTGQETKPVSEVKPAVLKTVKQPVAAKQTGKIAKTVKVMPTGKAAKPIGTGKTAQASKPKKDNKQIAKAQPTRKGTR